MTTHWTTRFGPSAALLAGAIWLALAAHQTQSHGTTQLNEMRLFLGYTWMDAGKFFVLPFLLVMVTFFGLARRRARVGPLGRTALVVLAALAALAVGTAIEFWGFPFGSYDVTFEGGMKDTWWLQFASTFLFTAAVVPYGIEHARAGTLPVWMVPVLIFGALTTVFLSPAFWFPGLVWIVLGLVLLRPRRDATTS